MSLLVNKFRETVSKSKDYRMKSESEFDVGYPTGFLTFDFANGTVIHVKSEQVTTKYYSVGVTDGSIVMLIGRSGCGKTTFAMQAAAEIVKPFEKGVIFHDDIEGGITSSRVKTLTGITNNDKYIRRNAGITAENVYERIKILHDIKMENRADFEYDTKLMDFEGKRIHKLVPTVFILDSLALLMPAKFTEEEEMSGQMSSTAAAKANAMLFKRLIPMLKSANIILMIINHINQKVDINPMQKTKLQVAYLKQGETLPGGNIPVYLANLMLRFDDNTKLKENEGFNIAGSIVDIGLVKSRSNRAGKVIPMVFDQENGFDKDLSMFLMMKQEGRINGAGAFLYLDDKSDMKFAQKNLKSKINESPEFREAFINTSLDMLINKIESEHKSDEESVQSSVDTFGELMGKINNGLLD